MYIKAITIENVRSIANLHWEVEAQNASGWHVIIGNNGAGKSSFIRSVALALVGPGQIPGLRLDLKSFLRFEQPEAQIKIDLVVDPLVDKINDDDVQPLISDMPSTVRQASERYDPTQNSRFANTASATLQMSRAPNDTVVLGMLGSVKGKHSPFRHIWSQEAGWFSVAYGPYRRFTGKDINVDLTPKLARHVSAFDESVALVESLRWLKDLQFKKLEGNLEGAFLDRIFQFVNQPDFLPFATRLDTISSAEVRFVDGNDYNVPIESLSDGYRSVLSMTFELLRQLQICYGSENVFDPVDATKVSAPGVVLIDEVDAHLHPTWQRLIGPWFRQHFPNMQFIVTTHSPLVCQAAEHGTVFQLPDPGSSEAGRFLEGTELDRVLYGNILDAYSTGAFGDGITRSEAGEEQLERLAELNLKEIEGTISKEERKAQERLRTMLPTASHIIATRLVGDRS